MLYAELFLTPCNSFTVHTFAILQIKKKPTATANRKKNWNIFQAIEIKCTHVPNCFQIAIWEHTRQKKQQHLIKLFLMHAIFELKDNMQPTIIMMDWQWRGTIYFSSNFETAKMPMISVFERIIIPLDSMQEIRHSKLTTNKNEFVSLFSVFNLWALFVWNQCHWQFER